MNAAQLLASCALHCFARKGKAVDGLVTNPDACRVAGDSFSLLFLFVSFGYSHQIHTHIEKEERERSVGICVCVRATHL